MPRSDPAVLTQLQGLSSQHASHAQARSYTDVRDILMDLITSGGLVPGARLPSERPLHEALGVARGTIVKALGLMESEGAIHRLDRRGWFVSPPRVRYDPSTLEGFHTIVSAQGRTPSTHTLSKELAPVGTEAASVFGLDRNDPVFRIIRRRSIDGRPVLMERIFVDPQRYPGLIEKDLDGSLSAVLEHDYGSVTTRAQVSMYPSTLSGEPAKELQVSHGTPSLYIARTCYSADGRVTEYNQNFWHHNAIKLVMSVTGRAR